MNLWRQLRARLRAVFGKGELDAEMNEEMRSHIEMRTHANVEAGMQLEEARLAALKQFGWTEAIKEECRKQRGVGWIENFVLDLRFGARQLRKNPGSSAVAVFSVALGIAANTTIFSFVNMLLLRPPAIEAPSELCQVWRLSLKSQSALERYQGLSYPGYAYFRDNNHSFIDLAAFDPETPFVSWNRGGSGEPIQCQFVSGDFFKVCGVKMNAGRPFASEEDRAPGADPVVVASHTFWKNKLGGDPRIVGRTLMINGITVTVVGVAPDGFTGLLAGLSPDLWAPFMMAPAMLHDPEWHTRASSFSMFGVGRLKPGIGKKQAESELTGLTRQLEQIDPKNNRDYAAAVFPSTMIPGPFRPYVEAFTGILMGAVFMVLLIVCANTANLTLARTLSRRRELAVRSAVGASRKRLIFQILAESALVAALGGSAGLLLTMAAVPPLLRLVPATLPIRPEVSLDHRVFLFTAFLSLLTGLVFGIVPAWRGTSVNPATALKENSPAIGAGRSQLANALVIAQMAVCLVLLISGSLCLRSLFNARHVDLGFQPDHRVTAELNLKDFGYSREETERFNPRLVAELSAMPEFEAVSFADYLPLETRLLAMKYHASGTQSSTDNSGFILQTFDAGPGYFKAMGTPLLAGREFTERDDKTAPATAIVNRATAERLWPGQDPVGKVLTEGDANGGTRYDVVGVVENGKYRTLGESPQSVVFRSRLQNPGPRTTLVAHVRGDPSAALNRIRDEVQKIDPRLSITRLITLDQHLALALFPVRVAGIILGALGAAAMMLAVSGLFAVIAYSVSRRTREIGIRMALGARNLDVLMMVVRQGAVLAGIGGIIGLGGALAAGKLLKGLLFGISPTDPFSFAAVPLLLFMVALAASWLPGCRAAKVDPIIALRDE